MNVARECWSLRAWKPATPYPSDGGDEEWFLVAPHRALVRADAPQRADNLRAVCQRLEADRASVRVRRLDEEGKVCVNGRGSLGERSAVRDERRSEQYSLAKILGIWALAAVPMGILGWIVFPLLAPDFESDPLGSGVTRVVLLTLGLVWLFVLSMIIVRREEGDLRWATVKRRLRLNAPREPATGEPRARLWLWVVPFLVAVAVVELVLNSPLENAWVSVFPFLAEPAGYSFDAIFESREILGRLEGAWWFFALFVMSGRVQHDPGGGVPVSGRVAAQDGRRVRTLELGGQRRALRPLSRSPALGDPELRPHRSLVHFPGLSLQEHVDVHHPPLRTECVLRLLGARGRVGVQLSRSLPHQPAKASIPGARSDCRPPARRKASAHPRRMPRGMSGQRSVGGHGCRPPARAMKTSSSVGAIGSIRSADSPAVARRPASAAASGSPSVRT